MWPVILIDSPLASASSGSSSSQLGLFNSRLENQVRPEVYQIINALYLEVCDPKEYWIARG